MWNTPNSSRFRPLQKSAKLDINYSTDHIILNYHDDNQPVILIGHILFPLKYLKDFQYGWFFAYYWLMKKKVRTVLIVYNEEEKMNEEKSSLRGRAFSL